MGTVTMQSAFPDSILAQNNCASVACASVQFMRKAREFTCSHVHVLADCSNVTFVPRHGVTEVI